MTSLKINNQTYDLLKQEFRSNGNGNGYHHVHGHDNEAQWLDDDFIMAEDARSVAEDTQSVMEGAVRQILESIGEDPERQGLQRTPLRVAKAYAELTSGYHVDTEALINDAVFDVDYDEMVLVKDIDFYSMCEHHMLPFYGKAHVAYIPDGKVIGLSKIPRIVEMFARRLQVQERMTQQIADFLQETLQAQGVAVVIEGQHMCAAMRGVKKANARMTTSAMLGSFKHNPQTRGEFLDHVGRRAQR
jgi:GTP cyclohydrolase IA